MQSSTNWPTYQLYQLDRLADLADACHAISCHFHSIRSDHQSGHRPAGLAGWPCRPRGEEERCQGHYWRSVIIIDIDGHRLSKRSDTIPYQAMPDDKNAGHFQVRLTRLPTHVQAPGLQMNRAKMNMIRPGHSPLYSIRMRCQPSFRPRSKMYQNDRLAGGKNADRRHWIKMR